MFYITLESYVEFFMLKWLKTFLKIEVQLIMKLYEFQDI